MILVDQVSKSFGPLVAVDNVSFSVAEGETLILLGTSGCGKTTTLRMINRLLEPSAGKIWINNEPIINLPPEILRRGIGYVLQHTGLFPHYTIAENMATVPKLLKWESGKIRVRALELMDKLHLPPDLLPLYPHQLSGGQQQRVGLARALMAGPPILLLDEPFGALDPITRAGIRQEFKNLDELKRKTIIMVTHDVAEAFELGDRICLMDKGRIVQMGTPAELLFKPQNKFVSSFLKDQQVQLQFKEIKLCDLPGFQTETGLDNMSLWDAFAYMLQPGKNNGLILKQDTTTGTMRPATWSDVLAALPQMKQN